MDYPKDIKKLMIDSIANPPEPSDYIPTEQLASIGTQINGLLSNRKFRSCATYIPLPSLPNPSMMLTHDAKAGKYDDLDDEAWEKAVAQAEQESVFWNKRQFLTLDMNAEYAALEQSLCAASQCIRSILTYMIAEEHSYARLQKQLLQETEEKTQEELPEES